MPPRPAAGDKDARGAVGNSRKIRLRKLAYAGTVRRRSCGDIALDAQPSRVRIRLVPALYRGGHFVDDFRQRADRFR